ncbi:MAG: membrane-associated protein [Alphaproteobacteria bacterium]|nr:membrane-associated protein [Alphaproteobacteria bacterium]
MVPVYWQAYGPTNFLWLSDIALLLMLPALWFENRLIASMMAVGVLPLEIIWMLAFFSGGTLGHMADYMFDSQLSPFLRGLSLFHFPMPAAIIYMLLRYGYDARAVFAQMGVMFIVLPLTYALTKPADNVNWVFGFDGVQTTLPPLVYLAFLAAAMIVFAIIPMHFLLKNCFHHMRR